MFRLAVQYGAEAHFGGTFAAVVAVVFVAVKVAGAVIA